MLKTVKNSLIISVILTALGLSVNYISYISRGTLLFGKVIHGGEWIGELGFGLLINHTYPMTYEGSGDHGSIWLELDLSNLILTFVVIFIVILAAGLLIKVFKRNRA